MLALWNSLSRPADKHTARSLAEAAGSQVDDDRHLEHRGDPPPEVSRERPPRWFGVADRVRAVAFEPSVASPVVRPAGSGSLPVTAIGASPGDAGAEACVAPPRAGSVPVPSSRPPTR